MKVSYVYLLSLIYVTTIENVASFTSTAASAAFTFHREKTVALTSNRVTSTLLASSSRREVLINTASSVVCALVGGGVSSTLPAAYADEMPAGMGSSPEHPIVVLGAGGRCGLLCVKILEKKGLYVKAVTRSGRKILDDDNKFVSYGSGDVTTFESLSDAVKGASGVIFAASASKNGGDAAHVDYFGVANTANACVANKVPKLAVISSGAVTRPSSIGFKITNVFGRIMDYKIAGETELRKAYEGNNDLSYVVVRPGGLSDEDSKGPSGVEVSQGDILSAEIGREDVAEVTVSALLSSKTNDATIECYGSGGETLFGQKTGPSKLAKDLPDPTKYKHLSSESYDALFDGILSDSDMLKTGIVSDYTGSKIEPLSSF